MPLSLSIAALGVIFRVTVSFCLIAVLRLIHFFPTVELADYVSLSDIEQI